MNYQDRYIAHQLRKKETLLKLIKTRHSTRVFSDKDVEDSKIKVIEDSLLSVPSSCDRHGVYTKTIKDRDNKNLLGGFMVGGVGWIHRAPVIMMLFADPEAYKENLIYTPYLDSGVVLYHILLVAESLGLKACYVNPQVRGENQVYFRDRFGYDIFCGAVAIGYEE
jgi:nitroreductase